MNQKDASILAQVAVKSAAAVFSGTGNVEGMLDAATRIHAHLLANRDLGVTETEAVQNVQAAFPGSQVLYSGNTPPPPGAFQGQSQAAPAQNGNQESVEQAWQHYFANPDAWYDNRNDPKKGNGPDFRRKSDGRGLWIYSAKYKKWAPDWVLQRLGYQPQQPAPVPTGLGGAPTGGYQLPAPGNYTEPF